MAVIANSPTSGELGVGTTNRAARAELYDAAGNVVLKANSDVFSSTAVAMPVGGADDTDFETFRAPDGSQAVLLGTPMLTETWDSTTLKADRWFTTLTTYAVAITVGSGIQLNSGASAAASASALLRSYRLFQPQNQGTVRATFRARGTFTTNSEWQVGLGTPSTGVTPTVNGAYWQATGSVVRPVITNASTDVAVGSNINPGGAVLLDTEYYSYDVAIRERYAVFVCRESSTGNVISRQVLRIPDTTPRMFAESHVGAYARLFSTGVVPPSAPSLRISDVSVVAYDSVSLGMDTGDITSGLSLHAVSNPQTGAQAAQHANSAAPANATLSNAAAGYTTLGGLFSFAAVAGAATDYSLFAFAVPTTHELVVTGVQIETWNTGAAVATTATLLHWFMAVNSASANLSTGVPIKTALGAQSFAVGAAIGAVANSVDYKFGSSPVYCLPGRTIIIGLRMPVGTATASQVIQGSVTVQGYFR